MAIWVITGANRGIGLEMARRVADRGDRVIATARDPDAADALRALADAKPDVRVEPLDVSDADSVRRLADAIGDGAVDVLVNNAGQGGQGPGIADIDWTVVARMFDVNGVGPMRVTQALLPALRRGADKLVVQMSSELGSIGDNYAGGGYAYRTSKAALNMLNRCLARELADEGFRCVAMHPGWVRTDMGGPRAPVEVADSVIGMLEVIDRLGPEDNGSFYGFDGAVIPW